LGPSTFGDAKIAFFQKNRKHQQHSVTYPKTIILSITLFLGFAHHIVLKKDKTVFQKPDLFPFSNEKMGRHILTWILSGRVDVGHLAH
jgi:hypothetical protein